MIGGSSFGIFLKERWIELFVDMEQLLIFSGCYLPGYKGGGPIRTIANMVEQMGDEFSFSLYTADRDLGDEVPYIGVQSNAWQRVGKANVFYASPGLGLLFVLQRILYHFAGRTVHLNSFFSFRFSVLPLVICRLVRSDLRVILGPRGEFSVGALGLKSRKKYIFIRIARFLGLYDNVIWHASSDFEAADIRRVMGSDVRIHVAVDIAIPHAEIAFNERLSSLPLRIIFISRISPMKNLLGAIEVLSRVRARVVFDVYGPAEDEDYWVECQHAVKFLPVNVEFNYCGVLLPVQVPKTLAEYDLFFLPTLGENFGHVIAESLSSGLPILISDTTPWRDLADKSLGWDIPLNDKDRFAACIEACASMSSADYMHWRQSIRSWALENVGGQEVVAQHRILFMNRDLLNEN